MFGKKKTAEPAHPLAWHFRAIGLLAMIVLGVDAFYSGRFGLTIDSVSMIGLSAISLGSGLLLVAAIYYYRLGFEGFAKGMAGVWAVCFVFNVLSNMGVATSNRVVEVEKSNLKQAVHTERAKSKAEAKARLVLFERQLANLLERDGWAGSVTATGLRNQLASLRSARDSEAALGGCGQKCRGIENQIVDVQGKIGIAEQRQNLESQIAASKRVLAEARNTLATTDAGVSNTAAQASLYSRWTVGWMGDGESVGAVRNANELMGIGMAFVIAVASVGLTLAGVWQYLMTVTPGSATPPLSRRAGGGGLAPRRESRPDMVTPPVPLAASQPDPGPSLGVAVRTVGSMNLEALKQRLQSANGLQVMQ